MDFIKGTSLFMIYLVVSLSIVPFLNAEVYSASIAGKDGAAGVVQENDTVTVTSSTLLPALVDFSGEDNFTLMTCDTSLPVKCTYTRSFKEIDSRLTALVKETGSLQTKNLVAIVDSVAPKITSIAFSSVGWGVKADYSLLDKASVPNNCSGFKKIELLLNGKAVANQSYAVGVCQVTGSISGTIPNTQGNVNASLALYDYVGLRDYAMGQTYSIESKPPKINSKVDVFKPGTAEKVSSVPPNSTVKVDIAVSVTDEAMGEDVFANFSEAGAGAEYYQPSCSEEENSTRCVFGAVPIKMAKSTAKIIIYARDVAGNLANLTTNLPVSVVPPRMSFKVTAKKAGSEKNVTVIPGPNATKALKADVFFEVKYDSPVTLDRLEGDFSEIAVGGSAPAGNSSNSTNSSRTTWLTSEQCTLDEEANSTFMCKFPSVELKAKKTGPKINITAVDESGGRFSQAAAPTWTIILNAGTVTSLTTAPERCYAGKCYMGKGNNLVTAQITTQSLFDDMNIRINGVKPTCNATSGLSCTAQVPGSSTLALEGTDDFGHPISGAPASPIVYDPNPPALATEFNQTPDCPTSSETLVITVNATDTGGSPTLVIKSNTQGISSNNLSSGQCTKGQTSNQFACSLSVSGILNEPINTELEVVVEDLAGNSVKTGLPVSICVLSEEVPNFISSIAQTGLAPRVDMRVASKVPVKIPFGLQVNLADSETYLLERSQVSCSGTPGAGEAYIITDTGLSPTLMVQLSYAREWGNQSKNMSINCTQEFKVRHQNTRYNPPEVEPIQPTIILFNQPLGTINETYTRKVEEQKARLRELDSQINKWQRIHNILGNICKYIGMYNNINTAVQTVRSVVWAACVALGNAPFVGPFIRAAWMGVDKIGRISKVGKDTVGGSPKHEPNMYNALGHVLQVTCAVYTCKIYDINSWASWTMEFFESRRQGKMAQDLNLRDEAIETDVTEDIGYDTGQGMAYDDPNKNKQLFDAYKANDPSFVGFRVDNGKVFAVHNRPSTDYWRYDSSSGVTQLTFNNPQTDGKPISVTVRTDYSSGTRDAVNTQIYEQGQRMAAQQLAGGPPNRLNDEIQGAIGEGSWIYNPYKSSHYDALCPPAILFNNKKERELGCKRLGCIQQMAQTGGPLQACEYDYEVHKCMYVDSAKWKIEGSFSIGNIGGNILRSLLNNALGIATIVGYRAMCRDSEMNPPRAIATTKQCHDADAGKDVGCGLWGFALDLQSLSSMLNSEYWQGNMVTEIRGQSYCSGVNYAS